MDSNNVVNKNSCSAKKCDWTSINSCERTDNWVVETRRWLNAQLAFLVHNPLVIIRQSVLIQNSVDSDDPYVAAGRLVVLKIFL